MVNLSTSYLGLDLKNPLVASASPLSEKLETVLQLEESGVAAVVMYSLFEEQILHESLELDHFLSRGTNSYAEAPTYLPELSKFKVGPDSYIENLRRIKQATSIPVIGSLNGVSSGGWLDYAKKIEQAGADALELNIYYLPTDISITSSELEDNYVRLVKDIRSRIGIPIAVKLSPFFSSLPNLSSRLVDAGADGLVLFNRFYQPDFNLDELEVVPNLELSSSKEVRLPLRWIALMYGHIHADFALTSGVHTHLDILKAMMAGASVAMTASALLRNGPTYAAEMLQGLQTWMVEHEYESIHQMKGSLSAKSLGQTQPLERANYMKELASFKALP
jgi:dihydroorotate dehydrogenase (fumarate)